MKNTQAEPAAVPKNGSSNPVTASLFNTLPSPFKDIAFHDVSFY
jgi:hypothetical protein